MMRNIEIKARVQNLETIRRKTMALTPLPSQIVEQTDTFFVVPRGRLKVRGFPNGSGELIFYDRPDQEGPKESSYTVCPCADARALSTILGNVFGVRGTVVKRREVFLIGRTRVHLDQVSTLGCFVELEVVLANGEPATKGESEAQDLLQLFGIPQTDLIAGAYIDLLEAMKSDSTLARTKSHEAE